MPQKPNGKVTGTFFVDPRRREPPMVNNIVQFPVVCQEKIFPEDYFNFCKKYCKIISSMKKSPWKSRSSPLSYFTINKKSIKLSKNQRKIIILLHQYYFSHGKPYIVKRENIKNIIKKSTGNNLSKSSISKSISALCKRNIICRVIIKDKFGHKSVILPHNSCLS
jgi:hypothetical protein